MDVSEEIETLISTIKVLAKDSDEHIRVTKPISCSEFTLASIANEIIDVSQINFSDDETWLLKYEGESTVTDLSAWLHEDSEVLKDLDFHTKHFTLMREINKLDSAKKIDSRTFTRPKKRFNRPSLDFNDSTFKVPEVVSRNNSETDTDICESKTNGGIPLTFDFTEPTNVFNNIKGAEDLDSFQNMSPPSLVSSSMFSSIMENSFIKNDPVLREIRDTDYTDVILQGCDSSVLQSFAGSCSSIDSDTPEGFLKRSVETTFVKNDVKNFSSDSSAENVLDETFITNNTVVFNNTFQKETKSRFKHLEEKGISLANNISNNKLSSVLNNTYNKSSKENLNDTFNIEVHNDDINTKNDDLNRTILINNDNKMDSNRLNYTKRRSIIDDSKCDLKYGTFLKRNRCSLGSSDSLDCASSLSNSSSGKGSSKMLNMAEIDAIVLQQEQSLQVMSTPKPSGLPTNHLYEYTNISPIQRPSDQPEHFTDSDGSSNDDYLTVESGSGKSLTSGTSEPTLLISPKNVNNNIKNQISVALTKNAEVPKKLSNANRQIHYGSYSNLHKAKLLAQQDSKKLPSTGNIPKACAQSNLKNMDAKLKSSYTQLKPVFTNLPSTVSTNNRGFANNAKTKLPEAPVKIAEVTPTLRAPSTVSNGAKVVGKASGLPRPVSAIPRPSRIPGPQSARSGIPQSRPTSRINVDTDF